MEKAPQPQKRRRFSLPLRIKLGLMFTFLIMGMALLVYFTFAQTTITMQETYEQESDYYNINSFMNTFIDTNLTLEAYLRSNEAPELELYQSNVRIMNQQLDRLNLDIAAVGTERYLLANAMRSCFVPYYEAAQALVAMIQEDVSIGTRYAQMEYIHMIAGYMELYTRQLLSEALSDGQTFLADSRVATQQVHNFLLLLVIIVGFFLLSMLYELVRSIVTPVLKLSAASREITEGNFDVPDVKVKNHDEIYELTKAFNRMKRAMKNLVTTLQEKNEMAAVLHQREMEAMESKQLLEQAKIQQLRSQINPHFLFNTLNIISRTARREKAKSSEKLILALARLFRYSLKTDDLAVPLAREINIVNDYISIQTTRFESRVALRWRIAPDVDPETTLVPAFLFQPLVENAIIHGLEPKIAGGVIRIRLQKRGEKLHIIISDNGVGMTQKALEKLMHQQTTRGDMSGIGVGNVRSRLLLASSQATFDIRSHEAKGTSVMITMPLMATQAELEEQKQQFVTKS